jgi:VCBS repeat-containing protein/CshA-type fibril repeat protein
LLWRAFDGVNLSAPSTIALTVTPVDDLPVGVPDLITATEDGDPVVGDVLDNDINLDSPIDTLSVIALRTGTVGAGSGTAGSVGNPLVGSYGSLTVNANGGYSYTLDNALATVQALKSGETLSDRFTYTLSDGHSTAEADITVTVEGSNDAPQIIGTPATLVASSIPENASNGENPGVLISTLLADVDSHPVASDIDAGSDLGIAIYASSVSNGMSGVWQYSLDGGSSWMPVAVAFSDSAALLLPAAAKLRFVADDNADDSMESGIASIRYYAWDGSDGASAGDTADVGSRGGGTPFSTAGLAADFIVSARNDVPTLTPVALVLDEGNTATITATELPVFDQDNQSDQLTFRVEAPLPSKGVFLKNGIPLSVGGLFTQDDVLAGNISYRHTSGELSADASDSVWFALRDGAGGVIPRFALPITILDVNAQIAITGTTQAVPERIGDEATDFTVLTLGLSDADGDLGDLDLMTLTITTLPDPLVGRLQYWDGGGYVDVPPEGVSLSKTVLLANPLHFISTGAEPAYHPSASFDVEASDNNRTLTPTTSSATVTLTIGARNDAPLPLTQLLTAPQGGPAVAITPAFLTSTDTDSDATKRVYTVSSFPNAGLLRLNGVIIGPGATFTEADLSAGLLTYAHDGSATDANPLSVEDHFDFLVNDRDGGVSSGTLEINVSPVTLTVPDPGGTLLGITPEGLFTPITSVTLAGSDSYTLSVGPAHGVLYLNASELAPGDSFSQAQLAAGEVVYVNLGDEPSGYLPTSYRDAFTVARNGPGITGNSTVEVIVTPVDDAPTILQGTQDGGSLMEESADSGLGAFGLNGATNAVKLTVANLQYVDPDTDPDALSYVLESAPLGGDLRRWDGVAWVALAQGGSFAALDVENGKIAYFHSADSELRSDSITVHLRDGGVVQVGNVLTTSPPISEQGFVTVNDGTNTLAINKGEVSRSPSRTVTFTIANVNDAPVASDRTFTVDEGYDTNSDGLDDNLGRIQTLDASILVASDSEGNLAAATYTIVSLPLHGSLEIKSGAVFVALVAGDLGTAAAQFDLDMLNRGLLRYVQDGSESTSDSFTWRVNDNAADAPVNLDSNVATVTINILPQNDPPVVFNNTGATIANGKAVPEGGVRNITRDMLGSAATASTDVDNTNRQTQFRVTAATKSGTLYLDKAGVITVLGLDASFTLGDIQGDVLNPLGYLKYRHNGSETPLTDHFDFKISDGSGDNEPDDTFNFEIIPVNDAPQLSGLNPLTYFEDDGATLIDASVLFNDVDLANGSSYNPGTTLTIAYTSGGIAGDQLSVRNQGTALGQVSVAGDGTVSYHFGSGALAVGTIDNITDGVNGNNLLITFNANANVVAVKAVLENLTFHNTDLANASQVTAQATRSLSYTFVDGGGTDSYVDDGLTTLQGADTVTASNTIIVKQRNDAPVMSDVNTALASISEDETTSGRSVQVADLLNRAGPPALLTSDVDNGAVQGIAINSLVSGNGNWQYSLDSSDGSDGTWSDVGSVSATSSLLLDPSAWLRFIPNGENATSASFNYRAWDRTTGSIGGRANSTFNGGTTAFSSEENLVSLTVTAVNDAPVLADTPLAITENEDVGAPGVGAGTLISSLVGGVSDVDDGAVKGLAVWLGANAGNGTWRYSIDDGASWSDLDAADAANARLLAADARIHFEPDANYNGRQDEALALYAWDQSSGNNGESFNVGAAAKGGTTAFSTTTDTVLLTVTALNDAPTISGPGSTTSDVGGANENTRIALGSNFGQNIGRTFTLGDIDLERGEGSNQGQITLSVPHGAFVLDTTSVTVTAGTQATDRGAGDWGGGSSTLTFTGTLLQLQAALDTVEYVPGDDPDTSETITVTFNDLNNAGAGSASGGSDVHSVETSVDINNIAPVNDAPTSTPVAPHTVSGTEDSVVFFTGADALSIADVDARDDEMAVTLSIPQGTLTLATTNDITFANGTTNGSGSLDLRGTVANINAALASLTYTPLADANSLNVGAAARTLSFAVSDQGFGLAGIAGVALSAPTREILIDLTEINDDPLLDVDTLAGIQTSGTLAATESRDGSTATVVTGITLADPKDILDSGYGNVELEVSALHGTLSLDAAAADVMAVVSGRSITLSGTIAAINTAIADNHLKYLPDTNFSGPDVLSLAFNDLGNSGGGELIASGSLLVTVAGINDAPAFAELGGGVSVDASFVEDGPAVVLDADATLSDPELSAFNNWGGAVLTLQRSGVASADDVFGVTNIDGVNFNATDIRIGTTVVGSFTNSGGVLTITFNDATTTAQANRVLQAVTYSNSNDNPPSQVTIGYTINDGNTNSGATAQGSGGALEGSGSVVVAISANNDAPVLDLGDLGAGLMDQFFEDRAASQIAPHAVLSDPELSFLLSGDGNWGGAVLSLQRSGPANADDVFGLTAGSDVNFNGGNLRIGTAVVGTFTNVDGAFAVTFSDGTSSLDVTQVTQALTYRNTKQSLGDTRQESVNLAWTISDGNTGDNDTAGPQGLGGPKQAAETQTIILRGANDAPELKVDTDRAISVPEDNATPLGDVGVLVSTLTGDVTDADENALGGVAIIDSDTTLGTWFYSIDDGSSWSDVGVVTGDSALLLRDSDRLYFQPNPNSNGTVGSGLTLRAWDTTLGVPGLPKVDATSFGGTTAFSSASDVVSLTVSAVNDAPTGLLDRVPLPSSLEDAVSPSQATIANLFNGAGDNAAFSDAKDNQTVFTDGSVANSLAGIVITDNAATAAQGTWQYSTDGNSPWTDIGTGLTTAGGLFLPGSYQLRFVPNADWNGTPGELSVRLVDDSAGVLPAAGDSVEVSNDTSLSGASTRYSDSANAVSLGTSITSVNDAPAGTDKTITAIEDTAYQFQASDFGFTDLHDSPPNSLASVLISTLPVTGTLKLSGTALTVPQSINVADIANLTWAPPPDVNGTAVASFTFQLVDDGGILDGGINTDPSANTITLDVNAVADIVPDSVTTNSTAAITFDPLAGTNGASADNFEDPAAAISVIGDASHGSAVLNPDGTITYTPTPGYVGPDSFSYTVTSGGVSETAMISVIVTNAAPLGNPDSASTPEDTPVSGNVLDNDTDSDPGDSKTLTQFVVDGVTVAVPPGAVGGSTTIAGVGTLTLKADGSYRFTPVADWNGNVPTVTYTLSDVAGATATATLDITVTPVADITADSVTTNSTAALTFNPLAGTNGATADTFDDPAAAISVIGDASHGSAVLNPDGTITYTPTPGYVGPDSFSYTVTSGGVSETATISVIVTNAAPLGNPDSASTPEDTPVSGNVLDNDTDSDPGDSKTLTQFVVDGVTVAVPPGAVGGSTTIAGVGTLTLKADGSYRFTPVADWNGNVPTVTYTLSDVAGATATATLDITVTPVADITTDSVTTNSTAALTFNPLAGTNGATADTFEDPAAAISAIGDASHGSAVLNPDGTITYIPTPGYVGPDSFSYTVTSGGIDETATISVIVTNAAPVGNPDSASTAEDTPVSGNVLDNDTDSDPGDSKTLTQFVVDGVTVAVPPGAVGGSTTIAGVGTLTLKADGSYRFTPVADWNGNVPTVTYTLSDVAGATATATLDITVTPVADITADSVTTNSTAALTFNPLAGTNGATADTFDDPAAAISVIGDASHGSAVLNPDGTITYTPTPGYVGPDSFSYTVTSGGIDETATISVIVTNAAPVGSPDIASTPEDTPVSGNVLDNDTDSDPGDSKTLTQFVVDGVTVAVPPGAVGGSTTIAGVGTLTLKADGSYSFTPVADWNGNVPTVTYTLSDVAGATATATLDITVTPVADITADSVTTNSTAGLTFDPLRGTNGATADTFDDPAAAISAIGDASHGSAVLNPDGTITYTPTPGYVGPDSFSYTVTSGGVSETATISVIVTNSAPVGSPDTASTPEDTPVSGNVLDNDTDSDPGDSKTLTQFVVDGVTVSVPPGAVGGSATIAGVGTLTLKADGSYSFTPVADWNGNVPTVTYTLSDVAGATATATLNITVTPVADITADSVTTNSTAALTFNPLVDSNGASADNFEDPAAAISAIGDASHGSAVLNPDGTITYTPTPGYVGPDSFSYTVTSGGIDETAMISVIVTNAAPVGSPDIASTPEDTPVSGNVLDNDTDSDPGDSKTLTQFVVDGVTVAVPPGAVGGSATIAGVGTLTLKADGSYSFTPVADWNGNVPTVTYTLSDVAGATATATLNITVTPVADITADSVSTNSTAGLTFDPLGGTNGATADTFDDPAAAISVIGDASHGSAVLNPDGTITYTPTPGYVGPDSFSYTVTSGGVSETATISVIVTNAAPVGSPDIASTPEDTPVSGNVLDNDTDSDPGDSKTLTQFVVDGVTVAVPPGAVGGSTTIAGVGTLTLKADGSYSFTPVADWNGNVPTVTYTLRDVAGATATATLNITVTPVADITADSVTTNSTAALTFNPLVDSNGASADNFEDPAAAISAIGDASHGSAVLNPDGTITYTPTPGYVGPDSFSYTVTSGGVSETAMISVIVTNAAPVGSPDIASTPEDTPVSGNVLDNDTDSDPGDSKTLTQFVVDGVTVAVPPGAVGGSATIAGVGTLTLKADGSYSFTPVADWNGNVPTVTYTLSDVAGATATATLNITVTPVADITADSVTTNSTAALTFNPLVDSNGASADNFEEPGSGDQRPSATPRSRQRRAQSRRYDHLHPDAGLRRSRQLQLYGYQRRRQRDGDDQRHRSPTPCRSPLRTSASTPEDTLLTGNRAEPTTAIRDSGR